MNNIENKLKNLTAFEMCPADLFREIEDKTCLMALSPRGVLAKSGDPVAEVYIVLYGTIKLQDRLSSKKSVIYSFLSRGDFFGAFLDLRNYNVYPCDAVAVDDCGVLKIPVAVFQKLIKVHPPILQSIWQQMNDQLHDLHQDRISTKLGAPARMAEFLLRMLKRQPRSFGNRIMIRLSRKDIAAKIGAESETVVRILSDWKREGWIRTENKFLELLDLYALEKLI